MVEWWKGELLIREKKISLLVMFCQCTISFGKQKLYVKSGFNLALKTSEDSYTYKTDMELCKQK